MPARDDNGFIALGRGRLGSALLLAAALAVMGVAPGTASAARISSQPTTYIAGASEQNDVTITYDQTAGTYTLTDTGVTTISDEDIGPGGCEVSGNVATCPDIGFSGSPPNLHFSLGDGDDRLTILSANPAGRVFGSAGDGSDTLDASRVATTSGDNTLTGDSSWSQPGTGDLPGIAGDGDDLIYGGDTSPSTSAPGQVGFQIWGEGGADRLYAGSGNDWLQDGTPRVEDTVGEADLLDGGAGEDQLDHTEGADTLNGGAGDDRLGTETFFFSDNAVDNNSCGAGSDQVLLYPGDLVATDCESASQLVTCPEGVAGPCSTTVEATAPPPPAPRVGGLSSALLSWALESRATRPRVRLAPIARRQIKPGRRAWVTLHFQRKQVGRALRGRKRVGARVAVKRRTTTRRLSTKRTPFVLRRAR